MSGQITAGFLVTAAKTHFQEGSKSGKGEGRKTQDTGPGRVRSEPAATAGGVKRATGSSAASTALSWVRALRGSPCTVLSEGGGLCCVLQGNACPAACLLSHSLL